MEREAERERNPDLYMKNQDMHLSISWFQEKSNDKYIYALKDYIL